MRSSVILLVVLIGSMINGARTLKIHQTLVRRILKTVAPIIIGSNLINIVPTIADLNDYNPSDIKSIERVERLSFSLNDIENEINTNGNPESVLSQIKFLLKTYDVKDNLQKTFHLVNSDRRSEARDHSRAIYEYLTTVLEYFPEDVDPITGKRKYPPQVLLFAQDAIKAAKKELNDLNKLYPKEIVEQLVQQIKAEYSNS